MTNRSFSIEDTLWLAALAKAATEGRPLSEVIREKLSEYVTAPPGRPAPGDV